MASFSAESVCQSGDIICDVRNEVLNVLLEAFIVLVAVGLSTKLWSRVLCKKVVPGKGAIRRSPCKGTTNGGQPNDRIGDVVVHNGGPLKATALPAGSSAGMVKFNLLFRGYAANRDVAGILRTLEVMTQQGTQPDDAVFDAALGRFPTNHSTSASSILCIFDALVRAGLKPSKMTVSTMLDLLAGTESWEFALNFLKSVERRFGVPAEANQYAKLLRLTKAGNLEVAKKVYEAMVEDLGEAAIEQEVNSRRFRDWSKAPTPVCSTVSTSDARGADPEAVQQRRLVAQFLAAHRLDRFKLEKVPEKQLRWIMDEDFLLQSSSENCSPTSVLGKLVREAAQKPAEFWDTYPTAIDVQNRLTRFIALNGLDARCAEMLQNLPVSLAQKVMDYEFVIKVDLARGTASAKVVGHILRFRRLSVAEQA